MEVRDQVSHGMERSWREFREKPAQGVVEMTQLGGTEQVYMYVCIGHIPHTSSQLTLSQ